MVSVDTVYQKVLALANKEQRGYITPQEFNLFADHAQMEILEQYFYDISQRGNLPGNSTEYSDVVSLIDEKLSLLRVTDNFAATNGKIPLTDITNLYKLGSLYFSNDKIEEINYNEFKLRNQSPLTAPSVGDIGGFMNWMYMIHNGEINIYPQTTGQIEISYIKKPNKPNWNFVIVNDKPLYNANTSINFELHEAEESELIHKVLQLAGINIKQQDIAAAGVGLENAKQTQEKQ